MMTPRTRVERAFGPTHRVLLIGPWRSTHAGGGCCAADPGAITAPRRDHEDPAPDAGAATAAVRALRAAAGTSVDVQLVDPRNTAFLLPAVMRDARWSGAGWGTALASAIHATTPWTLVIDGRVAGRGRVRGPDDAVARLGQVTAGATTAGG